MHRELPRNLVPQRGRGAVISPPNRFERLQIDPDPGEESTIGRTQFLLDGSKSILSSNDSPDLSFDVSINPYRGCEHGCAYCYARPTHEFLGFNSGIDFESRIMVKMNASKLLREELAASSWRPKVIAMSGVTDCYQPVERKLGLTRGCLQVLAEFRNPVGIVTKNHLVTRDKDLLAELASHGAAAVYLSIHTLDAELSARLEPRASLPALRLQAISELSAAGIPCGVVVAPVIPGLNDHEIPAVLKAAAEAGAEVAGWTLLRLPHSVKEIFRAWMRAHFPEREEKVFSRLRSLRGGNITSAAFGERMTGKGIFADQITQLFEIAARKAGLNKRAFELSTASFRRAAGSQLGLFGEAGHEFRI